MAQNIYRDPAVRLGSFGFQKVKKNLKAVRVRVGSAAVRFLAVQETVRFYECDSCAT